MGARKTSMFVFFSVFQNKPVFFLTQLAVSSRILAPWLTCQSKHSIFHHQACNPKSHYQSYQTLYVADTLSWSKIEHLQTGSFFFEQKVYPTVEFPTLVMLEYITRSANGTSARSLPVNGTNVRERRIPKTHKKASRLKTLGSKICGLA
jgi:hypothetical protein